MGPAELGREEEEDEVAMTISILTPGEANPYVNRKFRGVTTHELKLVWTNHPLEPGFNKIFILFFIFVFIEESFSLTFFFFFPPLKQSINWNLTKLMFILLKKKKKTKLYIVYRLL